MPNLVLLGHEWDTCSDMLPINMLIPIIFYTGWLIPLSITTYIPKDQACYANPGHAYYRVGEILIYSTFCAQLVCEILAALLALRGSPLQTRRRWLAERFLLLGYIVSLVQFGGTIYGSWTLATYKEVPCKEDKTLRPLVISSWILLALSLTWTLLCLKWFPNQQGTVEAWVKRLRFLCSLCACLGFQTALEPLRKMDMAEEGGDPEASKRENALVEHLAETFHVIFGDVNFTASDRHAALVLATALQQKRRHEHIRRQLAPFIKDGSPDCKGHKRKLSREALEHSITTKFPSVITPSSYARKICPQLTAQESADRYTGLSDRVGQMELEEALTYFEYAVAAYYVQDEGLAEEEKQSLENRAGSIGELAGRKVSVVSASGQKKEGGRHVEVALPAQTDRVVEKGMSKTAVKAVQGHLHRGKQAVPAEHAPPGGLVMEDGEDKVESSRCGVCRKAGPVVTPLDKLDCIYSRADNTILGTLPYMIALDWEKKAVVLGVRGTSSMSDALTDALAQPIPIVTWLSDIITEPDGELAAVHSGILASAAALHHDLEEHGILAALFTGAAVDEAAGEAFKAGNNTTHDFPQEPAKEAAAPETNKSKAQDSEAKLHTVASSPFATENIRLLLSQDNLKEDTTSVRPVEADRAASTASGRALMARDEDVVQRCREAQRSEKARNSEARRAWGMRRSPSRRRMTRHEGEDGEMGVSGRVASLLGLRQRTGSVPSPSRAQASYFRTGSVSGEGYRPQTDENARMVELEEGRRSRSLSAAQHPELTKQAKAAIPMVDPAKATSTPSEWSAPAPAASGHAPRGGARRSMERSASQKLPDAIVNAGKAVKRIYTEAVGIFRDEPSPAASPRRKREPGHGQGHDRLDDMFAKIEEQMKRAVLPKIFRRQHDLRTLAAVAVAEEQQRRRVAHRAAQLKRLEERKLDCRGWKLVLTGHSLGAGVAALLALKLRTRFPGVPLQCLAFCPPGALVTLGLSRSMEPFCTSIVVGKDGVPRASLGNLSRLVDEVVTALARGRRSKARVLLRNLTARGRAKFRQPGEFYDFEELPEECRQVLEDYAAGAAKRREAIGQPVYPPGRVIFCRRLKESATETSYDAVWVPPEEIMNEGFLISSKMLKDHLCDTVTQALEKSIERLKPSEDGTPLETLPTMPDSSDEDTDTE